MKLKPNRFRHRTYFAISEPHVMSPRKHNPTNCDVCLNCPKEKCKGYCERVKKERGRPKQ